MVHRININYIWSRHSHFRKRLFGKKNISLCIACFASGAFYGKACIWLRHHSRGIPQQIVLLPHSMTIHHLANPEECTSTDARVATPVEIRTLAIRSTRDLLSRSILWQRGRNTIIINANKQWRVCSLRSCYEAIAN